MIKLIFLLFILFNYSINSNSMEKKLYHHLPDGTFRNPEGSPGRKAFENLRKSKGKDINAACGQLVNKLQ